MKEKKEAQTIDHKLSREFAEQVYRIREAINIRANEDFLLLTKRICGEPPYLTEGGILRLNADGAFLYRVKSGGRKSTGPSSYMYCSSPFFDKNNSQTRDVDGIIILDRNPAENEYGEDNSYPMERDGTLIVPEDHWPKSQLATDFISYFTPSALVGHWTKHYDQKAGGFPGCDHWDKLDDVVKRDAMNKIVSRLEKVALLKNLDLRRRYKRS